MTDGRKDRQTDNFAIGKTACIQCSAIKMHYQRRLVSINFDDIFTFTYTTDTCDHKSINRFINVMYVDFLSRCYERVKVVAIGRKFLIR